MLLPNPPPLTAKEALVALVWGVWEVASGVTVLTLTWDSGYWWGVLAPWLVLSVVVGVLVLIPLGIHGLWKARSASQKI